MSYTQCNPNLTNVWRWVSDARNRFSLNGSYTKLHLETVNLLIRFSLCNDGDKIIYLPK